jgi:hypothetical protein
VRPSNITISAEAENIVFLSNAIIRQDDNSTQNIGKDIFN